MASGDTSTGGLTIEQMIAAAGSTGGGSIDSPVVPLWMMRPAIPTRLSNGIIPKRVTPDTDVSGGYRVDRHYNYTDESPPRTKAEAEAYWFDMSDKERKAFAEKASLAGLYDPRKDGPMDLARAWAQAVGMAADYNSSRADQKSKWISPFEALDKLYAAGVAANGGKMNGYAGPYTGWRTNKYKQVTTFTDDQIAKTAQQILQEELGRDPTKAEIAAYTIAANRAAKANPQTVTERSRDTAWDEAGRPIDSETTRTVEGETFDPSLTIQGMARNTQEHRNVKAATDYFNAAMQAIGSIV